MPWPNLWKSSTDNQEEDRQKSPTWSINRDRAGTAKGPWQLLNDWFMGRVNSQSGFARDATSTKRGQHGENTTASSHPSLSPIFFSPSNIISTVLLTGTTLAIYTFYASYLRRFPTVSEISPSFFRKRSLVGRVTSVGDGDNFRLYHTPGGRLMGWGWLPWRRVPDNRKELKGQTIHIRLAGIDAPELSHFGKPSQPYAQAALDWLTAYLLYRQVRVYIYKRDQYDRVVATVYVRRGSIFTSPPLCTSQPASASSSSSTSSSSSSPWLPLSFRNLPSLTLPFLRQDVGLQMLRAGLATVYEAKTGAEFGPGLERRYRRAESWAKFWHRGIWQINARRRQNGAQGGESPREYKTRYHVTGETGGSK